MSDGDANRARMKRTLYGEEHEAFRAAFRSFLTKHAVGNVERWIAAGFVDREFWEEAGRGGFLAFEAPAEVGGLGVRDFRFNAVIAEETADAGVPGDGFTMHNDIIAPYLVDVANGDQRRRWLPGFVAGRTMAALALSEPGTGSDLARIRTTGRYDGDHIVLDGAKTFITNGSQADLVIVLARTGERDGSGLSLVVVEADTPGFARGRSLCKVGRKAQDTAELYFDGCAVPRSNVLGAEGGAFSVMRTTLARERLAIALGALAAAIKALALTLDYTAERSTFGKPLARHQVVGHKLAEMHTNLQVAQSHLDRCVLAISDGTLTAEDAAAAKFWMTDLQWWVLDECVQLFGGYGYMDEYPISRLWRDGRVQRIYGGANEIMKDIVARSLLPPDR